MNRRRSSAASLRHRSAVAVIFAVLLGLLGSNVTAVAAPQLAPTLVQTSADDPPPVVDEEYEFYFEVVQRIAEGTEDVEVREAAVLALAENSLDKLLWFLDYGYVEARAKAAERKRVEGVHNRELVTGWAQTGGPNVRARAQEALNSNDDQSLAEFVAWGREIAETQDNREANDSAAEKERITGRVRDMVAHGGPQVKVEGEAILIGGDYARIRTFYLTGYAEANKRDHDFQQMILTALEDRNRAATELDTLARRSEAAANARAEILRANITAIKYLDDATFAMRMGAKAAHRADEILREDKPGRAHGQRGRDQDLDALRADATRYAEQAGRAATNAAGTTAQVQNAAVRLIDTGMTNGLDWAKVTIAVGSATGAAALATQTTQHATEATLADSRALDADSGAQEHADNARKYREEAERQAVTAAGLADAAKKQQEIAIGARDRAGQQKQVADDATASARTHAANARNARLSAESAASNAVSRSQSAVTAHGDAVKAGIREQAALDAVQRSSTEFKSATSVCTGRTTYAEQVESELKIARDKAISEGKNADEATKDIADAAGRARSDATAAAGWANRANSAAATARSEAISATAAANQARAAAARADQEAVTARRAADEANRLALEAANVAIASRTAADMTRFEAEASVSEANQAVFQSVIADRAASAASASASMIIDPARAADAISRPYAAINADARKVLAVTAEALTLGEEQARSAREKAQEAGQAADSARQAADDAVAEVKPAYEAAARASESANQAAQYALGANDAANQAAQYAQGAHNAAASASQYASSARADAAGAGNAAAMASSAAQSAGQAAAASEQILDWAKQATAAIHGYTAEVGTALDQFTDARKRAEEAQKKAEQDAQHKQDELNRQFISGAKALSSCAVSQFMPQCLELQAKTADAMLRGLSNAGEYVTRGIQCQGGDEAACRAYEDATKKIVDFAKQAAEGFAEGAKNTWDGILKLGDCALHSTARMNSAACGEIAAGLNDLVQNPYKLVHLDVWHDNPGKAFGLISFDILAAALTTPLGGSGSALSKALDIVSTAIGKATAKISGGVGRIGSVTVKLAETVTGKLPGAVGEVIGLTVRVENGLAKIDGAVAIVDGVVYRVESFTIRLDGDLSKIENATVRIDNATMRIENGVAKLDGAQIKWDPPKPCVAGSLSVASACGTDPPDNITGKTLDDEIYYARENKVDITLDREQNARADELLARAEAAAPKVSQLLGDIRTTLPGAQPEGLADHLKGYQSLKRKLFSEINPLDEQGNPLAKVPLEQALTKINDALRYTITLPYSSYTAGVTAALTMLDQGAFKVTVVKNFWRRNPFDLSKYRGINITVVEKATGLQFEVQFHTPDSYIAKTREHSVYAEGRTNADPTESEIEELKRQSEAIFGQLRTPIGSVYIPELPR